MKPEIALYYCVWLGCLALVLVASLLYPEAGTTYAFAYSVPTWLCVMLLNAYEGHRLMSYLKENHHEKWAYITWVPVLGPGGQNSFRSLPFLYSRDDLGDPVLGQLKRRCRAILRFTLLVFVHYIFVWVFLLLRADRAA